MNFKLSEIKELRMQLLDVAAELLEAERELESELVETHALRRLQNGSLLCTEVFVVKVPGIADDKSVPDDPT